MKYMTLNTQHKGDNSISLFEKKKKSDVELFDIDFKNTQYFWFLSAINVYIIFMTQVQLFS